MYSRAERYRRLGIEAQQRAKQATNPNIKLAFTDVADGWFALAERVTWLDRHYNAAEREKKE
jgi:antibiotic biosynthesis monooxygenase (ABM) superfamily enzyme